MKSNSIIVAIVLIALGVVIIEAGFVDLAYDQTFIHQHSIDMVVDFRQGGQYGNDTGRFKRDMQGGKNQNPGANQFWFVYKSVKGFTKAAATIVYYKWAPVYPTDDRKFYVSADNKQKKLLTLNVDFTETGDNWINTAYFIRNYTFTFPSDTHFFELHFADWKSTGEINYWTPQVTRVQTWERCDPVCGNGICGEKDAAGREENCLSCPKDCGLCPVPVVNDTVCDLLEGWAPRVVIGEPTENAGDFGFYSSPEDCGYKSLCGNLRCEDGEVCRSNTQNSCSADCCNNNRGNPDFTPNPGNCTNGLCDGNESCSTCPQDCGVCPSCGDSVCNGDETCKSCPGDCGTCQCSGEPTTYTNPATTSTPATTSNHATTSTHASSSSVDATRATTQEPESSSEVSQSSSASGPDELGTDDNKCSGVVCEADPCADLLCDQATGECTVRSPFENGRVCSDKTVDNLCFTGICESGRCNGTSVPVTCDSPSDDENLSVASFQVASLALLCVLFFGLVMY